MGLRLAGAKAVLHPVPDDEDDDLPVPVLGRRDEGSLPLSIRRPLGLDRAVLAVIAFRLAVAPVPGVEEMAMGRGQQHECDDRQDD